MISKPVADESMVKPYPASGYTAGAISKTLAQNQEIDGKKILLKASCMFTHPTQDSDEVTLEPQQDTAIQIENDSVLREGDQAEGDYGNILKIDPGQTKVESDTIDQ